MWGRIVLLNRSSFKVAVCEGSHKRGAVPLWGKLCPHGCLSSGAAYAPRNLLWNLCCLLLITSPVLCAASFFFVRVSRKFLIVSTVYSLKDNKATARNCGFKMVPCTFLLKRKRLKGDPRHLLINWKCTVTINLSRSRPGGRVLLKLEERQIYQAFWSLLLMVSGGCVSYLLS